MIEMEYIYKGENKVLVDDKYKDYRYIILSIRGSHPCAYIELPKGHPLWGLDYESSAFDDMPVHGGCTYSSSGLILTDIHNSWVVGWDYAHLFDYITMPPDFEINPDDHKWTIKEIIEQDVIPAIDWLIEGIKMTGIEALEIIKDNLNYYIAVVGNTEYETETGVLNTTFSIVEKELKVLELLKEVFKNE